MNKIINNKVLIWIYKNSKPSIPAIILLTLLSTAISLISLKFTLVSKSVIDIATNQSQGNLINTSTWFLGLLILQLIIQISITFINVNTNAKMDIILKRNIFKKLINKDYLSVSQYHSGELLNRLTSDINIIVSGIISIIPNSALLLTNIIGGFLILFSLDRFFALLILTVGPILLISSRIYSKRYKQLHKDCQQASGMVRSFMQEALQNILVIKSFNNQNNILNHNENLQKKYYKLQLKRTKLSIIAHICMYLAFNAGYAFAVAYGAWKLSVGAITFGTVTAMLQLVGKIQVPFRDISGLIPQILSIIASSERIMELENINDEIISSDKLPNDIYSKMQSIEFENVTFGYGDTPIILNKSFSIKKGEFVAIAGESGAGKSTSVKLLLGIIKQTNGEIYLKTDNKKYYLNANTRNLFAYVPQGNLILSGTIRENIAFAKSNATDNEIIRACKIAQIWDYISTLDNGLDTIIGENGLGLSEGQAQRLSIARAILYDAPIILLDEATSALDSATELNFLQSVRRLTDKTCIIVSHKKAAFEIADNIIYF